MDLTTGLFTSFLCKTGYSTGANNTPCGTQEIQTTTAPAPAASVTEVDDTNATVAVSVVVVVAVIIVVALAIMVMFRIRNKSHKIDAIDSDVFTTAINVGAMHTMSLDSTVTQPVRRTLPGETYM